MLARSLVAHSVKHERIRRKHQTISSDAAIIAGPQARWGTRLADNLSQHTWRPGWSQGPVCGHYEQARRFLGYESFPRGACSLAYFDQQCPGTGRLHWRRWGDGMKGEGSVMLLEDDGVRWSLLIPSPRAWHVVTIASISRSKHSRVA